MQFEKISEIITGIVSGGAIFFLGWVLSMHREKRKHRKAYEKNIEANFSNLTNWIRVIINAIMNSNGYGEKFQIEYEKELKKNDSEKEFDFVKLKD